MGKLPAKEEYSSDESSDEEQKKKALLETQVATTKSSNTVNTTKSNTTSIMTKLQNIVNKKPSSTQKPIPNNLAVANNPGKLIVNVMNAKNLDAGIIEDL